MVSDILILKDLQLNLAFFFSMETTDRPIIDTQESQNHVLECVGTFPEMVHQAVIGPIPREKTETSAQSLPVQFLADWSYF